MRPRSTVVLNLGAGEDNSIEKEDNYGSDMESEVVITKVILTDLRTLLSIIRYLVQTKRESFSSLRSFKAGLPWSKNPSTTRRAQMFVHLGMNTGAG
jgi:hypothetical protein